MPRGPDSGQLDLAEVFRGLQREMLAKLRVGGLIEHANTAGAEAEHQWVQLLRCYLPSRYWAGPAFVIDWEGNKSRQIDIAIYDNLYSAALFKRAPALHLPAESVYAVLAVKHRAATAVPTRPAAAPTGCCRGSCSGKNGSDRSLSARRFGRLSSSDGSPCLGIAQNLSQAPGGEPSPSKFSFQQKTGHPPATSVETFSKLS
jgi:hypothetical protein